MKLAARLCCVLLGLTPCLKAENWPEFRGPTGQGLSTETGVPLKWSATENIAWKTAVPGQGWSSPIVWEDSIFVTTAADEGRSYRLLCFDRKSGGLKWDKEVFQQDTSGRREGRNSHATSTPATDGQRVYVLGFDGTFAAVGFDGEIAWVNRDFKYRSQHGLATSLRQYGDLVIAALDPSGEGDDGAIGWKKPWEKATVVALARGTGKVRWTGKRGLSRVGHVTPLVLKRAEGDQLISGAGDVVQGFDLKTGERLWSAYSQGEGVVPSIVAGGGLVYTSSGFEKAAIRAYKPDGRGDVTGTHMAWEQKRNVPMIPSFLYAEPYLYTLTEGGILVCRKSGNGEPVWQERLDGNFGASPVFAEGRIYLLSEAGETTVIEAGPAFKVLARNAIGATCKASMAVSGRQFILRSDAHLLCIGK